MRVRPGLHATIGALALALLCPAAASAVPDCDPLPRMSVVLSGQGRLESIASDARGRLFYTDATGNRLLRVDGPGAQPVKLADVPTPGGLAFEASGSLLAGFGNGVAQGLADNGQAGLLRLDPETGEGGVFVRGLGMANGVARGADGTLYASNDFGSGIDRVVGQSVEPHWAEVQSGNGLVVDSEGRYLYAAQTFRSAAIARVEIANPSNVETHFVAPASDAAAGLDGMTRDAADRLYVAANGAGQIWRVDPDLKACALARGLSLPSAVAFGGGSNGFGARNLYAVTFSGLLVELADATDRPIVVDSGLPPAGLRLRVRPRRVRAGRSILFRMTTTAYSGTASQSAGRVIFGFARRKVRSDLDGYATIRHRFKRPGLYRARASSPAYGRASALVRVIR